MLLMVCWTPSNCHMSASLVSLVSALSAHPAGCCKSDLHWSTLIEGCGLHPTGQGYLSPPEAQVFALALGEKQIATCMYLQAAGTATL